VHFEPLRPASRGNLIAGLILGPILWLVALAVALIFAVVSQGHAVVWDIPRERLEPR
jgi:hypothetical protein